MPKDVDSDSRSGGRRRSTRAAVTQVATAANPSKKRRSSVGSASTSTDKTDGPRRTSSRLHQPETGKDESKRPDPLPGRRRATNLSLPKMLRELDVEEIKQDPEEEKEKTVEEQQSEQSVSEGETGEPITPETAAAQLRRQAWASRRSMGGRTAPRRASAAKAAARLSSSGGGGGGRTKSFSIRREAKDSRRKSSSDEVDSDSQGGGQRKPSAASSSDEDDNQSNDGDKGEHDEKQSDNDDNSSQEDEDNENAALENDEQETSDEDDERQSSDEEMKGDPGSGEEEKVEEGVAKRVARVGKKVGSPKGAKPARKRARGRGGDRRASSAQVADRKGSSSRRQPSRTSTRKKVVLKDPSESDIEADEEEEDEVDERENDEEDEDGSEEKEDEHKIDSQGRTLRHSKRARRPAHKLLESKPSSSDSEDAREPRSAVDATFGQKPRRRTSTLGGGGPSALKPRGRKVLTDAGQKRKPPLPPARHGRRTSTGAGVKKPRGPYKKRTKPSGYSEPPKHRNYHEDDDESISTTEGLGYRDNEESDDDNPWYHTSVSFENQRQAENAVMHNAHLLGHSWDNLHLGTHLGSAALNNYLRAQLRETAVRTGYTRGLSVPQFTAQQCLPMIQSLRPETVLPPRRSELHSVLQQRRTNGKRPSRGDGEDYMEVSVEMEEEEAEEDNIAASAGTTESSATANDGEGDNKSTRQLFYGPRIPYDTLADLYQFMANQDVDGGRESRRQLQFLSSDAIVDRMRGMENKYTELRLREERIKRTARSLGIGPVRGPEFNVQVNRLLGQIPHYDSEQSED